VTHSFELINRKKRAPHRLNIARFHNLCHLLKAAPQAGPLGLQSGRARLASCFADPLRSTMLRTAERLMEQVYGRLRYE
jgi:hypothetical protein